MTARRDKEFTPNTPRRLARVHIYGAGIAGLTAAHELARRGFRVRVIECAQECDEMGRVESYGEEGSVGGRGVAVGGMARTQFLRVEKGAQGNFQEGGGLALSDEYRFFYEYDPAFVPTDEHPYYYYEDDERLAEILAKCRYTHSKYVGVLHLRTPPSPERNWERRTNAEYMRKYLVGRATWPFPPERVVVVDEENAGRLETVMEAPLRPLEDQEGLWFEFLHFLPGEHGFRFFPSSYRHLASTMVETPLLDEHGNLTPRRVFDNLVPSSFYGIASQGRRIRFLRRAPASRPVEMLQELRELAESGYPPTDTLQFTLRIWRYLCTSSERRKAEYEKLSWWEYLEGYEPKTGTRRYTYSAAFMRDMKFAPRVLAAFDGEWGDARTNGNTLAQLYLNNLLPMPKTDGTLNGPTTLAWLRPWRRYLERHLGVEFALGKLSRFESEEGQLVAWWRPTLGEQAERQDTEWYDPRSFEGDIEPVDYYLVATDAATAEHVTRDLLPIGVIQGLRGFTTRVPPNPRGPEPAGRREKKVLPGHVPWDRFQTLTGIQFFFPSTVRLAEGYLYFLDAPWGLSAINSQQYWASPPAFWQDGFGAMLSVDIGNWYVREPGLKSPSTCSREEIAHEVWRQIKNATEQHNAPLPQSVDPGFKLPEPAWYHMDRSIRFEKDPVTGKERPVENRMPYLIPIVGDWDRRPGAEPWDPMVPSPGSAPASERHPDVWQAPHGGYQVHFGKLVFAGTYLKTFTRMTTMESANESARHAVNAIIDHYLTFRHAEEPPDRTGASPQSTVPEYGSEGSLTGTPGFRMTPIGEYCRIWDPEKHELAELVPLRELDARLFAAGLPHVWDVLHLEPLALPLLSSVDPLRGIESLKSFLGTLRERVETMLKGTIPGVK